MGRNLDEILVSSIRWAPGEKAHAPFELTAAKIAEFASPSVPSLGGAGGLTEIALSDEVTKKLRSGLEPLGFDIEQDEVDDPIGGGFYYTLVQKNERARRLIRVPDAILKNPDQENLRLVNEVRDGFIYKFFGDEKEIKLYVFHGENPHGAYKLLMDKRWPKQHGVRSKFVPLSEVHDLDTMTEELRVQSVKLMFDLDSLEEPAPARRPPTKIEFDQILFLSKLLGDVPEFRDADAGGRRSLAEFAGIADVLADFDFKGGPLSVARRLVLELIQQGCLGSFLKVILTLPDLKSDYRVFLEALFEHYDLRDH